MERCDRIVLWAILLLAVSSASFAMGGSIHLAAELRTVKSSCFSAAQR